MPLTNKDIEVKRFEALEKDQTAKNSPMRNINEDISGLVKLKLNEVDTYVNVVENDEILC